MPNFGVELLARSRWLIRYLRATTTVAVSPAGHMYGGGVGADGYPAVVYVAP